MFLSSANMFAIQLIFDGSKRCMLSCVTVMFMM